jgi:hypothetical protein
MSRSFPLPLRLATLLLVLGSTGVAVAQPVGEPSGGRPTPQQWQKIFPEHRTLAIRDHQARIAILQKGERCISAAASADALRQCMREERSSYQEQRQRHRAEMRSLFQRNGISVPEWGKRGGKGRWSKGSGS